TRRVKTVGGGHILIDGDTVLYSLADKKLVAEAGRIIVFAGMTDIDIQQTVAIDVGDADARAPGPVAGKVCLPGHILEPEIPFVEKQFIGTGIAGKKNVVESVAIEIGDPDARAVVEVLVAENIERIVFPDIV